VSEVVFDTARRRVTVGRWSVRPVWIRTDQKRTGAPGATSSALVTVRRGVRLLVSAEPGRAGKPSVELWAGEPETSDGLAVVQKGDELAGVARIPLCGCGERGCGNAGVQLATELHANDLPTLVDLLAALPDLPGPPPRATSATWDGAFADDGHPAL
jgi:hypothetical protein